MGLSAETGIGGTTALELAASNITADTTTGTIDNTLGTPVTVSSLTTGTGQVTDAGNIFFDQSGGGLVTFTTITTSTTSANPGEGDISLANTDAGLTIDGLVTAGGAGAVDLDANGVDSDILVNAAIAITNLGEVQIEADDSVIFTATVSVAAGGSGNVSVRANTADTAGDSGDAISMADGALIDAGSGTILLEAGGVRE